MMLSHKSSFRKAFTLVELMVSVAIFVFMTALLVASYGNFNSSVLLTSTAYDVALAVRTAQTYGISVKNNPTDNFSAIYGIYINKSFASPTGCNNPDPTAIIFFSNPLSAVSPQNYVCTVSTIISTYHLKYGIKVSLICTTNDATACGGDPVYTFPDIMVSFKRPDPDAQISAHQDSAYFIDYINGQPEIVWCSDNPFLCGGINGTPNDLLFISKLSFVKIRLSSSDGKQTRTVEVFNNGQISVVD